MNMGVSEDLVFREDLVFAMKNSLADSEDEVYELACSSFNTGNLEKSYYTYTEGTTG